MGETLAAVMARLGVPLNLFNWMGWILWTGVAYGLARRGGLGKEAAVVLAVAVAMWPTVIRLINNQTVDIWLAVWWGAVVVKMTKINKRLSDWVWMGVYLGMMVGTKYSGLLFALVLIGVFGKKWWGLGWKNIYWLIPFGVVGGFWYLRNWILVGNPVYPATVAFWLGDPNFKLMDWRPWMTLLKHPGLIPNALVSEYLVWPILIMLPAVVRNRWVFLGLLNLAVFLCLPSWPQNMISDLRYTLVGFLPLLVAGWRWMKDTGGEEVMAMVAVMCMAAELTQLDYRPKLFLLIMVGIAIIFNVQYSIFNKKTK
jgi:hypothetical protein